MRKTLASLGFTSSTDRLSYDKARGFHLIASEIERLKADDLEKKTKKGRKG